MPLRSRPIAASSNSNALQTVCATEENSDTVASIDSAHSKRLMNARFNKCRGVVQEKSVARWSLLMWPVLLRCRSNKYVCPGHARYVICRMEAIGLVPPVATSAPPALWTISSLRLCPCLSSPSSSLSSSPCSLPSPAIMCWACASIRVIAKRGRNNHSMTAYMCSENTKRSRKRQFETRQTFGTRKQNSAAAHLLVFFGLLDAVRFQSFCPVAIGCTPVIDPRTLARQCSTGLIIRCARRIALANIRFCSLLACRCMTRSAASCCQRPCIPDNTCGLGSAFADTAK